MSANRNRMPGREDFGVEPGRIGVSYGRFFGSGSYSNGNTSFDYRIFSSPEEGQAAIQSAVNE